MDLTNIKRLKVNDFLIWYKDGWVNSSQYKLLKRKYKLKSIKNESKRSSSNRM